jgi:arabinofuranosyltransferase
VHIIDYYGLGDPLISRLPIFDRENWQVGHYARSIPTGYVESIQRGTNEIADPNVREIYRAAKILAKDPIWSVERFREILKANTGGYKKLIRALVGHGVRPAAV